MSIIAFMISLVAPMLAAAALIRACCPSQRIDPADPWIVWPLAIGLGLGLGSCSYFLHLVVFGSPGALYPYLETIIFAAAACCLFKSCRRTGPADCIKALDDTGRSVLTRIVIVASAIGIPVAIASLVVTGLQSPHGYWDAWAIWNLRARFLFRAAAHWRDAFDPNLSWSHPDYPVLLPGAVARSWVYVGREWMAVPISIGILFTLSTAAILVGAVTRLRGLASGLLAGLLLLSTSFYLRQGGVQYADTPVSFFVLAAIILTYFCAQRSTNTAGLLALAGLSASCAAWTKNEGAVFLGCWMLSIVMAGVLPGRAGSRLRTLISFAAGILPVTLILIYFKMALAPDNDMASGLTGSALRAYLTDAQRYGQVLRFLGENLVMFGGGAGGLLLAYLLLIGRAKDPVDRRSLACSLMTLALMITAIVMIYVVTPLNLPWHLETSGRRLLLQLYPSAIFVVFAAASPLERDAVGEVPSNAIGASMRSRALIR